MLQESQNDFPSGLLHSSVQLRDTSAPFGEVHSEDDSAWPSRLQRTAEDSFDDADVEQYLSSNNSATPGPSRVLPRVDGGTSSQAGRLREVMDALGQVPRQSTTPRPPPPAPRSTVESDLDMDSEDQGQYRPFKESMKDVFKRAAMGSASFDSNSQTPMPATRMPLSVGKEPETPMAGRGQSSSNDESGIDNAEGAYLPSLL